MGLTVVEVEFETLDVFTDRAFGGNPVAVVYGAEALSAAQMQQIATEFNLSETTFVLPPERAGTTARVRIFTPVAELPFAGHPNVGTAVSVAWRGTLFGTTIGDTVVFDELAGDVPLVIDRRDGVPVGAKLEAPEVFSRGAVADAAAVAACADIAEADVVTAHHEPVVGSCGLPFVFAEVASRAVLRQAKGVAQAFETLPAAATGLYLYTHDADAGADIDARMFAPLHGVAEDPATGGATVALGAFLGELGRTDGESRLTVRQGVDMGRPALMTVRVLTRDGVAARAWIGGNCVAMMRGTLAVSATG